MPLQAFNTDANGTRFHNMVSPQILANRQCYVNSQIQQAWQSASSFGSRYAADSTLVAFLPDSPNENAPPPATTSYYRMRISCVGNNGVIISIGAGSAYLGAFQVPILTDTTSIASTFVVATDKAFAAAQFVNSGTSITGCDRFVVCGVVNNPLFVTDLTNARFNNHFAVLIDTTSPSGARLTNMSSTATQNFRTVVNSGNYTFACSLDSGDGTSIGSLWATHLALVDNNSSPNDLCIGTVPPIVLIGRGSYTLGNIYKFNNVGEGVTNANAYDRWYIAGPTYGASGDRILIQVYYEA